MCEKEDWKSIRIIHGEVPLRELKQNWRRYRRELKILILITIFYVVIAALPSYQLNDITGEPG
jgi:hypothetical protein